MNLRCRDLYITNKFTFDRYNFNYTHTLLITPKVHWHEWSIINNVIDSYTNVLNRSFLIQSISRDFHFKHNMTATGSLLPLQHSYSQSSVLNNITRSNIMSISKQKSSSLYSHVRFHALSPHLVHTYQNRIHTSHKLIKCGYNTHSLVYYLSTILTSRSIDIILGSTNVHVTA